MYISIAHRRHSFLKEDSKSVDACHVMYKYFYHRSVHSSSELQIMHKYASNHQSFLPKNDTAVELFLDWMKMYKDIRNLSSQSSILKNFQKLKCYPNEFVRYILRSQERKDILLYFMHI